MNDIYQSPDSELIDPSDASLALASRWSRLAASIVDTLILILPMLGVMYLLGAFETGKLEHGLNVFESLFLSVVIITVFLGINYRFLVRDGQTIGKKVLGIRIVANDGSRAGFKENFLPRYFIYFIPGQIPVAGQFFNLVNMLFIFGKEKRCIHDLVGKTRVIKA